MLLVAAHGQQAAACFGGRPSSLLVVVLLLLELQNAQERGRERRRDFAMIPTYGERGMEEERKKEE